MDCLFCDDAVEFHQHRMAHRLFELSNAEKDWWLCRDCAGIREEGKRSKGIEGARGTCVDCDEKAEYGVAIVKKTPGGDVATDGTVFHVLCDSHLEERR